MCLGLFLCEPWIISLCALDYFSVSLGLFLCVPWIISLCALDYFSVCLGLFLCVPWIISLCALDYFVTAANSSKVEETTSYNVKLFMSFYK